QIKNQCRGVEVPVVQKDLPHTAKAPRLVVRGVHLVRLGGHSLAHSAFPPVRDVRKMESTGQNGMRAGEWFLFDKCILQDLHTDRLRVPSLSHAFDAEMEPVSSSYSKVKGKGPANLRATCRLENGESCGRGAGSSAKCARTCNSASARGV